MIHRLFLLTVGLLGWGWAAGMGAQEIPPPAREPVAGGVPLRLGLQPMLLPFTIHLGELPRLPYPLRREPEPGGDLPAGIRSRNPFAPGDTPSPFDVTPALLTPNLPLLPSEAAAAGEPPTDPLREQELEPLLQSEYAQVGVLLRARGEFGGDWNRFRPCETGLQESCDPGLFPELRPDIQFGLIVDGTVADRVHVDVDYDETREFSAANRINVYYQGKPGELLRRIEVGDVTLRFPESRFLTQGIPAGNFGFRALTDLGPLEMQTVWAQQNGDLSSREFQLSGVGGREAFIQEDTLVLDDADYVKGQFFFLADPREIEDFPHLDVLSLEPGSAPPSVAPGARPIQLYRFENDPVTRQQVEGYIQATAVAEGEEGRVEESGWFRYQRPAVDYFLHPSGLWVVLRRPLRQDEMLAVTYVTAAGDTVGDYNPEAIHNAGGRPTLRLLKASGPKHQPGSPTWLREMHQVYRVSGSDDVEPSSVALALSLGELSAGRTFKRRPDGEEVTLLKLMGLDEEAPIDQVDPNTIYRPAQDFFQEQPPVSGTFIVFPTLEPFLRPPPLPSLGLTAQETRTILGADANQAIYDAVDPVERENGGLYRLTIPFRIRSEGLISAFSLGALGIRDGSERIHFGDRLLQAGEDYLIDYDIGQVTLLNPEALFSSDPRGRIRASWEQKALFQIAPTSIFGMNARYGLGGRGDLHVLGLYQREQTLRTRPQLGVEPAAIVMGGVNADLRFDAGWLDRAARRLPGAGADSASSLQVRGEMALSLPDPNTRGAVYLDDFDATDELPLSLRSYDWDLGSAMEDRSGVEGILPPALTGESAASLVWQHTWIRQGPGGDSLGIFEGYLPRRDIDEQINIAGVETRQTGLRLTFDGTGGGQEPQFRSITTTLSNTGTDLTRSDFLEFYAAGGESLTLILDLGRVSEDAFFVAPDGSTSGVHPETGEPWGLGILDQEADPRKGEIWNDALDERGVWVETCRGSRGQIYALGDRRANCTRGNGRNDTEDLDGDGNLGTGDRIYRYVVELDGSSPYLARTSDETRSDFQLYRIPLRGPDALNVGGRVTEADWRAVKQLRMTVVGPARQGVSLVRMRLIGSRWVKRGGEGVLVGLVGKAPGVGSGVEVGPVSALSEGGGYQSPPGVLEELDNPSRAFSGGGVEFNEKSLSIQVRELGPGERAEVYHRFPQRPRNFLTYRQARIWVAAREGDWGEGGGEFFLKVGSDEDNFYLMRTGRSRAGTDGHVATEDWRPEVVVDFTRWLALRREAEEELVRNPPTPGGEPVEVWSADSTYAVFLKDRARAPNLAAVRELSLGIWNPTNVPIRGTVWVNELRLSRAVKNAGYAGYVDVRLEAPELLRTSVSYSGQGPYFRELTENPSYQGDGTLSVSSTLELGRVVPAGWGVSMPVTVFHTRLSQDPTFLAQTDVRAGELDGLRETGVRETRFEVGLRKTTPVGNPILDPLLDGLALRAGYSKNRFSTTTLESSGSGVDARAEYRKRLAPRSVPFVPGFARGIVRALLPQGMEESVLEARLRWAPEQIQVGTLYSRREQESYRFEQILVLPSDSLVTPTRSPREALETTARVSFRPLDPVTAEISFFSVRDILSPSEAVRDSSVQPLLEGERWGVGSLDLGWETHRSLRTRLGLRPRLGSWLRTDFSVATDYSSDRNPALVERVPAGPDTLLFLQRNAKGNRSTRATASLEPAALAERFLGPRDTARGDGPLRRALAAVEPLFVSRQAGLSSRFFREPVSPGAGFQLGWGDMGAFRALEGDTASILTDRITWSAGTGVRLPMGLRVTGSFSDSRTQVLRRRSDRELRSRSWPDLRLSMSDVSIPDIARRLVEALSLSSGLRLNSVESTYGGRGRQRRFLDETQVPVEVGITWVGQVRTRYRGTFTDGDGGDPTGDTKSRRRNHALLFSSALAEPPFFADRLDGPLRLSMTYQYSSELNCRVPSGQDACVAFQDFLNRSFNLTLDTIIMPMEVGLHLTYTNRRSFVGRHDGYTQFQLGLFGQFLFNSGTFQRPGTGGAAAGF